MDDQRSLEAQLLGDMTYDDPRKKQQNAADPRLAGASVPMLDDMSAAPPPARPVTQYQQLTAEQIGILQQQRAAQGLPPFTDAEIAELQAEFIERQRTAAQEAALARQAAEQQAAAAMLLSDPDEVDYNDPSKRQKHELEQVDASTLLEEPAPEPERKVFINQEDLEAAKKEAAKRQSESLKEEPQRTEEDQKRARREMEALRQQQLADMAQAGFVISILVTVIGVLTGAALAWFAGRPYNPDLGEPGGMQAFGDACYRWGGIIFAILSISVVLRIKAVRGFYSFLSIALIVLLLFPGITVLMSKNGEGDFALTLVTYLLSIAGCAAVMFMLTTSDKLSAYYGHKEIMYD